MTVGVLFFKKRINRKTNESNEYFCISYRCILRNRFEIARSLARRGYNIVLTARSNDKLKSFGFTKEISNNFKVKTSVFSILTLVIKLLLIKYLNFASQRIITLQSWLTMLDLQIQTSFIEL